MARAPRTDAELRAMDVPPEVIRYRNGDRRVWQVPLVGVVVEGPLREVVPPSAEVSREEFGAKLAVARLRFRRR